MGALPEEVLENIEINLYDQLNKGIDKKTLKKLKKLKVNKSTRSCIFCQDEFEKNQIIRILPCKHYFHNICLKPWFKKNAICPMCRFNVKNFYEED